MTLTSARLGALHARWIIPVVPSAHDPPINNMGCTVRRHFTGRNIYGVQGVHLNLLDLFLLPMHLHRAYGVFLMPADPLGPPG